LGVPDLAVGKDVYDEVLSFGELHVANDSFTSCAATAEPTQHIRYQE
jgi:hypothetical protein